ncbi:MAG: extracellular solute-binding protein [Thermomicrobiales bacterium]|nr:extracellular solute-binding protein [Thermomicrobiales bacterium]
MTAPRALTRRQFTAGLAGAGAALAMPNIIRAQDKELRILTWEGYAEPQWLDPFQEATGARVNVVYTGSVDEMFAKMQGSKGADFDVVAFDTSAFARYIDADLLQPLDMAKLPNAANIVPEFQKVEPVMRGDDQYGVPFAWGSLPLIYDVDTFPEAPDSWLVMWDPQYEQQMIALDDANNSIVLAALVLGFENPYDLTDEQFEQVKQKLIEQKKLLLTYFAGFDEGVQIFAENGIKLMFSMGEPQLAALKEKGVNAALTIPKEKAIGWLDCWVVSSGAKNVDLAHAWIDACLDKKVGGLLSTEKGYGNTTDAAANEQIGMTYGDRLSWLLTPENFTKRVQIWNEVKAS